ncbi:MAG: ABC transporter permease [Acidobacteriota bacterium]
MSLLATDLKSAIRVLRKRPLMSAAAITALALGTGLTAVALSVVYGTMFRQLPFAEATDIVALSSVTPSAEARPGRVSYHDYVAWREQLHSYEGLAASAGAVVNLSDHGDGPPHLVTAALIEPDAFSLLRVEPQLGRVFTPEENRPGGPGVIVLSHGLWQRQFGSDPRVIGREIRVNVRRFSPGWRGIERMTIIGVMPAGFSFPRTHQAWLPLRLDLEGVERGQGRLDVFGRLAPEASLTNARQELESLSGRLRAELLVGPDQGMRAVVDPYIERYTEPRWRRITYTMLAGAVLVLLVACVNVANLLLARNSIRGRELALRMAVGASKGNVVSLLLTEGLILAMAGGGLGVLLAVYGVRWFDQAWNRFTNPSFWWEIRLDAVPLGLTLGIILAAGLFAGLLPALQAPTRQLQLALRDGGRGATSRRWTSLGQRLIIAEIALATGVLMATGLTVKSVDNLSRVDIGSDLHRVFTTRLGLWQTDYPETSDRQRFWDQLMLRVSARSGVSDAALASGLPMDSTLVRPVVPEGYDSADADERPVANFLMVSPSFFRILGIHVVDGRDFDSLDGHGGEPVAIVNQSFVRTFFPEGSALGRSVVVGNDATPSRIVGVVSDLYADGPGNERPEGIYVPIGNRGPLYLSLLVRTQGEAEAMFPSITADIASLDPHLATFHTGTVANFVFERTWSYRVYSRFYLIFGLVALFLVTLGLYSVISFRVSRRTQEIGIRMVFGASVGQIIGMIVRQGAGQVGIGIALGSILALWLTQGLRGILFELETWDTGVYFVILLVLALTGLAASLIPAHRASQVHPSLSLRSD